jgi:hypothetical protein
MPNSDGSVVITIKPQAKETVTASNMLFYILQKILPEQNLHGLSSSYII